MLDRGALEVVEAVVDNHEGVVARVDDVSSETRIVCDLLPDWQRRVHVLLVHEHLVVAPVLSLLVVLQTHLVVSFLVCFVFLGKDLVNKFSNGFGETGCLGRLFSLINFCNFILVEFGTILVRRIEEASFFALVDSCLLLAVVPRILNVDADVEPVARVQGVVDKVLV